MQRVTWRTKCAPVVERVILSVGMSDMKALRRALREAYPFKYRDGWPYTVWLSEIAIQTGRRKRKLHQRRPKKSGAGQRNFLD